MQMSVPTPSPKKWIHEIIKSNPLLFEEWFEFEVEFDLFLKNFEEKKTWDVLFLINFWLKEVGPEPGSIPLSPLSRRPGNAKNHRGLGVSFI